MGSRNRVVKPVPVPEVVSGEVAREVSGLSVELDNAGSFVSSPVVDVDALGSLVDIDVERADVVYGDGVCPLLVTADSRLRTEREVSVDRGIEIVRYDPVRAVENPTECPTCKKFVSGVSLSWSPLDPGTRDCMTAIAAKTHPVSREILDAWDRAEFARAKRIASRHPLGERVIRVLGLV